MQTLQRDAGSPRGVSLGARKSLIGDRETGGGCQGLKQPNKHDATGPDEVSGWDAKENFFVEKTTLEWKPEDKKSMLLRADTTR
jgi:hypothetical protein